MTKEKGVTKSGGYTHTPQMTSKMKNYNSEEGSLVRAEFNNVTGCWKEAVLRNLR
jgi:hypothetical protein